MGISLPCLSDLIFQDDAAILENNYCIIEKEKGTVTAWTKATPEEGRQTVLWMKSTALYDSKGVFIGVMGKVKDITEEMGSELLSKPTEASHDDESSDTPRYSKAGMFDKILGKAKSNHREGMRLSFREGKYIEAIPYFDQALGIDPSLPYVWHDRGVCFRELWKGLQRRSVILPGRLNSHQMMKSIYFPVLKCLKRSEYYGTGRILLNWQFRI